MNSFFIRIINNIAVPGISTSNIENATLSGTTINVSLGTGLTQDSSITAQAMVTASNTAVPSKIYYAL